ncbi:MAG: ArsR/SmtB family transcription factor [Pyrinomonadaceae bacterium]
MTNDRLTKTFSALADPTRRAILARLSSGEASVTELAKPLKMTMPAVTKHLKVLQRAGLIRQERRAQWRPCYLVAQPLKEASDWVEQYRKFWEASFDRLDAYLKVLQAQNVSETIKDSKDPDSTGKTKKKRKTKE